MKKQYILTSLLLCSLTLIGCDSVRNTLGLDHSSPNEWNTPEPSPGLILPPDFQARPKLPPPTPGAPNPHAVPTTVKAQKTVLGDAESMDTSTASSEGEKDIVEKASENQEITPDIRKKVDEEAQSENTISGKIVSKIQSWKKQASSNLSLSNKDEQDSKDTNVPKTEDEKNKDKDVAPES
jgi:hypothetical protein